MMKTAPLNSHRGFTLIEIMVVVVIIGVFAGIIAVSINPQSPERVLKNESTRLKHVIRIALDESQIQATELGLRFDEEGYQFLSLQGRRWIPIADDKALESHKWPEELFSTLKMEGFAAFSDDPEQTLGLGLSKRLDREEELENSEEDDFSLDINDEEDPQKKLPKLTPQIYILSSGEMTPFSLLMEIEHEGMDEPVYYHLQGEYSGVITVDGPLNERPSS